MTDTNFTLTGTLPSTTGSLLTNPASTVNKISSITVTNNNSTTETVQLYLVPNSGGSVGTADAATNRTDVLTLAAGEKVYITPQWTLGSENDSIQADTTTASKVVYCVNGVTTA